MSEQWAPQKALWLQGRALLRPRLLAGVKGQNRALHMGLAPLMVRSRDPSILGLCLHLKGAWAQTGGGAERRSDLPDTSHPGALWSGQTYRGSSSRHLCPDRGDGAGVEPIQVVFGQGERQFALAFACPDNLRSVCKRYVRGSSD